MSPIPMNSSSFEQVEPGTHPGRLFRIIDLGDQTDTFNGRTTTNRKVLLTFELTGEKMEDGRPFAASRTYTCSLHEKSAMRRDFESWFARPIPKESEHTFDLHDLMGKAALVSIAETENGKRKIVGLAAVPKGMTVPPAVNPEMYLSLEPEDFDEATLALVPEFWRDKITASPTYKMLEEARAFRAEKYGQPAAPEAVPEVVDDEDDIPW